MSKCRNPITLTADPSPNPHWRCFVQCFAVFRQTVGTRPYIHVYGNNRGIYNVRLHEWIPLIRATSGVHEHVAVVIYWTTGRIINLTTQYGRASRHCHNQRGRLSPSSYSPCEHAEWWTNHCIILVGTSQSELVYYIATDGKLGWNCWFILQAAPVVAPSLTRCIRGILFSRPNARLR